MPMRNVLAILLSLVAVVTSSAAKPNIIYTLADDLGWTNDPDCNLFNGAGLPATPFRTDDWQ